MITVLTVQAIEAFRAFADIAAEDVPSASLTDAVIFAWVGMTGPCGQGSITKIR